ncbi:uncharacterized protein [Dermacentor albipictus]|uniref:uncharacterized protein isoform X2 n=1 Tax=Dermacentor albipictus TaxID=60249 RepID=UPI0038FCEDBB
MAITCLINRGPSSYVLTVSGDHKLEDLKDAMAAHSSLQFVEHAAILQVHHKTFNTFVNVDENTTLEDNCIIRVLDVCIIADGSSEEAVSLNSSLSSDAISCNEVTTVISSSQCNSAKGRLQFSFPKTPIDIDARLCCCRQTEVPENLRRRIVDWLWFELSQYTLYPGRLYETAARELVQRYPQLRDGFGDGHMSWQTALRYKGKNTRKKLPAGIKEVDELREKAKRRKASSTCEEDSNTKTAKVHVRKSSFWNGAFNEGEDEKSTEAHIEIMKKEMRVAGGNADKIRESMHKTFRKRRTFIEMEKPAVTDLLQIYPALSLERELLNEFHRLTGLNAKERINAFVEKYGQRILALAPKKKRPLEEDPDDAYYYTVAVLMSLPRLAKEDPSAIIAQLVPGESHKYPKILHSAEHPATSSALLVSFETLQLTAANLSSVGGPDGP